MKLKTLKKFILHLLAAGAILGFTFPILKFFYEKPVPLGIDFYNVASIGAFFNRHMTLPPMMWGSLWWLGFPFIYFYGLPHAYLLGIIWNLANPAAILKIYMLLGVCLYLFFSYLVFHRLSKNRLFSLALVFALAWSPNLYPALFFGGNTNFVSSMFFLPLTFFFLFLFQERDEKRFLALGGLVAGLSLLSHSALGVFFVCAPAVIFLFLSKGLKPSLQFGLLSAIIGSPALYSLFQMGVFWFKKGTSFARGLPPEATPVLQQLVEMTSWPLLGLCLLLLLSSLIIRGSFRNKQFRVLFVLVLYISVLELGLHFGINPFLGKVGPDRTYWVLAFFAAALTSFCAYNLFTPLREGVSFSLFIFFSLPLLATFLIFQEAVFSYVDHTHAYPSVVNEVMRGGGKRGELVPSFVEKDLLNKRLFDLDVNVNMWWSTLFDLPLAWGYTGRCPADVPDSKEFIDRIAWLGTVIPGNLPHDERYSEEGEDNTIKFLFDWFGLSYFEGTAKGEVSYREYPFTFPERLWKDPSFVKNEAMVEGLHFAEITDEVASPIITVANAPTLAFVGSREDFDTFFRLIALKDLNSRRVVPILLGEKLSGIKKKDLSSYDAVLLYGYHGSVGDSRWSLLEEYVKNGGNLFIAVGSLTSQPETSSLPAVFPVSATRRGSLGERWETEEINANSFSPLIFDDGSPWDFPYADEEAVRPWAEVVLRQAGHPVIVSGKLGEGKVVWSGANLLYHARSYGNIEEVAFIESLLDEVLPVISSEAVGKVSRDSPGRVKVTGGSFKGVLFRESAAKGWIAWTSKPSFKLLKVYTAGPDFMYVRNPSGNGEASAINLFFLGSFKAWLFFILFLAGTLYVFDMVFLHSRLTSRFLGIFKGWWEREDI